MHKKITAAIAAAMIIFLAACNSGNIIPDEDSAEAASGSISEAAKNFGAEQESVQENSQPAQETEQEFDYTYLTNKIIFPAHEMDKTKFNAEIFETPKFTASFDLPAWWTTGIPADGEKRFSDLLWSPVNIYDENGEVMGTVAFNTFIVYDDTTEENFHRMVYNQLMLGSVINWEEEYVPVKTDPNGEIAVVRIRDIDLETGEPIYYPAILAYDLDLLVYIGIQFDIDVISEQQLFDIAESITFAPYDTASFIDENENAALVPGKEYSDPAELCADYLEEYVMSVYTGSEFDIHKYSSDSKLIEYASLKHDYERKYRVQRETMGETLSELTIHTDSIHQDEKSDGVMWLTVPYEVLRSDDSSYGRSAYFEFSENEDGFFELTMAAEFGYGDNYLIIGASYEKQQPPFDIDIDEGIENARKYT